MEMEMESSSTGSETMIMGALLSLRPAEFSRLIRSLACDLRLQQRRLSFLLLSPHHFSRTLDHLHSLSLSQKTLLLARLLLRSLSILLLHQQHQHHLCRLRLEDFDAALLLMTMCEVYDRSSESSSADGGARPFDWRTRIAQHLVAHALCSAELGAHLGSGVLSWYVDTAVKCRRLLEAVTGGRSRGGGDIKVGKEVATSVATVVSLPSVECQREGWECVVCKEEIEVGRDVCVLPCEHGFHWGCILPWLRKRNTCPCCRFELPTDDVFCEIERVWRRAIRMGQVRSYCGDQNENI